LTDAKSQVVTFEHDALNREILRRYEDPAAPTGDDILSVATSYDANGNPLSVSEIYNGPTGTRVTTKTYDNFDRLLSVEDPGARPRVQL
jgi:YD repeat-containing protein